MKPLLLTIPILFLSLSQSTLADYLDQRATGYDWTLYSQKVKVSLMSVMFDYYGLDKNTYSIEKGVKALDAYYNQDRKDAGEDVFAEPFLLAFETVIAERKTSLCIEPKRDDQGFKMGYRLATELGVVYAGMPKEDLAKIGYDELIQKGYRKEGNKEWITYLNWANPDSDLVTFYLEDGKVKGWGEEFR